MFIHLDRQRMELQVMGSATEQFVPSEQVKEINELVNMLKEKIEQFTVKEINPLMEQIDAKLSTENERLNPKS